tara:strand:+ start:69 stop:1439 length:1371 start_codon:yes stop_codon:yes gene_type:complete
MERKITVYTLVVVLFFGTIGAVGFGASVRHVVLGGNLLGWVGEVMVTIAKYPALVRQVFTDIQKPPLFIRDRFPDLEGFKKSGKFPGGVIADDGFLLLSSFNTKFGQSTIRLIRIRDQHIVHEWVPDIEELEAQNDRKNQLYMPILASHTRWLHPLILDDGGLVFHTSQSPLFKIDVCSNLEWVVEGIFHHAIESDAEENYWVSTFLQPSSYEGTGLNHRDDAIAKVSPNGEILYRKSVTRILEKNGYRGLIAAGYWYDYLHMNDVQPALSDSEFWQKGDLLVSLAHLSTVFLYRPSTDVIIWLKTGPWLEQHDVDFFGNSSFTVLSNNIIDIPQDITQRIKKNKLQLDGQNFIYKYDFKNDTYTKPYAAMLKKMDVRTLFEGKYRILDSEDIIYEESNYGRILRFNSGRLKWQFVNRVGDDYLSQVNWTRYLTNEETQPIIKKLQNTSCKEVGGL